MAVYLIVDSDSPHPKDVSVVARVGEYTLLEGSDFGDIKAREPVWWDREGAIRRLREIAENGPDERYRDGGYYYPEAQ